MAGETTLWNKAYKAAAAVYAGKAANLHTTAEQVVAGTANSPLFAGVVETDCAINKQANIAKGGIKKVVISEAVTVGAWAVVTTGGLFKPIAVNATPVAQYVVGRFENAASNLNDIVDMHIICPPMVITS